MRQLKGATLNSTGISEEPERLFELLFALLHQPLDDVTLVRSGTFGRRGGNRTGWSRGSFALSGQKPFAIVSAQLGSHRQLQRIGAGSQLHAGCADFGNGVAHDGLALR